MVVVVAAVVFVVVATFLGTLSPTEDFAGEDCLLIFLLLLLFRRLVVLVVLDGEGVDAVFVVAAAAEAPVVSFGGDDFDVASSDFDWVVLNCKLRDACSVFVAAVSLSWSLFLLLPLLVAFCCC